MSRLVERYIIKEIIFLVEKHLSTPLSDLTKLVPLPGFIGYGRSRFSSGLL